MSAIAHEHLARMVCGHDCRGLQGIVMKTHRKMIIVSNSFHNTEAKAAESTVDALALYRDELSPSTRRAVDRLRAKLCGAHDCACGVVRS